MPVVWIRIPKIDTDSKGRPSRCPYCDSSILQRWGAVTQPVSGTPVIKPPIYRYRCSDCGHTFRHSPDSSEHAGFKQQVRLVAGLLWVLGFSTRESVDVLSSLGILLSRMTVWREGQPIRDRLEQGKAKGLRRFAIDRRYIHRVSNKLGVVVALDLGSRRTTVLGTLDAYNPMQVKALLSELINEVEIEIEVHSTGTLEPCQDLIGSDRQLVDLE